MLICGCAASVNGRAALITGSPGSGKSTLVLEIMSRGGELVADDKVQVQRTGTSVELSPPTEIAGMIEARGVGILRHPYCRLAKLVVAVDLNERETERLPNRTIEYLGLEFPLIHGRENSGLAAALCVMLRGQLLN